MRRASIIFSFTFLLFIPLVFGQIKGTQDLNFIYYHVEGNIDNSFYPKNDRNYLYEGNIEYNFPFLESSTLYGGVSYRLTNDRTQDTEDASIEKFFIGIKKVQNREMQKHS